MLRGPCEVDVVKLRCGMRPLAPAVRGRDLVPRTVGLLADLEPSPRWAPDGVVYTKLAPACTVGCDDPVDIAVVGRLVDVRLIMCVGL